MRTEKFTLKYIPLFLFAFIFTFLVDSLFAQKADFDVDVTKGCDGLSVQFTDKSTGNIIKRFWNFGDGSEISNEISPSYYYEPGINKPGIYNVSLVVFDGSVYDTITKYGLIKVYNSPKINFNIDKLTGCVPLTVNFTDASIEGDTTIVSWSWDYGNGEEFGTGKTSSTTYQIADEYVVSLTAKDLNGCKTFGDSSPDTIKVVDFNADFTIDKTQDCSVPHNATFTNTSVGDANSWKWDFGNQNSSTDKNPAIQTYNDFGDYTISLAIQNSIGCKDTAIKTMKLAPLFVNFSANKTSGCAPLAVTFTNLSEDATSWSWDFGGQGTSATKNPPAFTFSNPGTFDIKLTSTKGSCVNDTTFNAYITVFANPVVDFTASALDTCDVPFVVDFTSTTPNIDTWSWSFIYDSTQVYQTKSDENPQVNFLFADSFDVQLKVVDLNGCTNTLKKDDYIKIIKPKADFDISVDKGCKVLDVEFTDFSFSRENITDWNWNFGNGDISNLQSPFYTYQDTGSFTVSLEIINEKGCKSTMTKLDTVLVGDHKIVSFTQADTLVCYDAKIQFNGFGNDSLMGYNVGDEWKWTFGLYGTEATQNPIHKFMGPDSTSYTSTELIVGFHGCYDTLKVDSTVLVLPPVAKFNITKANFCKEDAPFFTTFRDTSYLADVWYWDFGDGDTSMVQHPSHTFPDTLDYDVTLVAENSTYGCRDTIINPIKISNLYSRFTESAITGCAPVSVVFTSNSLSNQGISSYGWTYSDGETGKDTIQVTHEFSNDTTVSKFYDVKLVITDKLGCVDSILKVKLIDVNPIPIISFVSDTLTGCVPFSTSFRDTSITESSIISWNWKFGSSNVIGTDKDTSFTFNTKGKYDVTLTATDSVGCTGTTTKSAYIIATFPTANFTAPPIVCDNVFTTFTSTSDSTFVGDKLTYKWDFGDSSPVNSVQSKKTQHFYTTGNDVSKTFTAKLTVSDLNLCEASISKDITISVIKADFTTDSSTVATCPNLPVNFVDTSLTQPGTITNWEWNFGDGSPVSILQNPGKDYQHVGVYDVSLIVTNDYGCKDTLVMNDFITIGGPLGTFTVVKDSSQCAPLFCFNAHTDPANNVKWIFRDGKKDFTNDTTVCHTYLSNGDYYPVLIMTDPKGCSDTYVSPSPIHVNFPVIGVNVKALTSALCLSNGGSAEFTSATGGTSPYSYIWGNGVGSTWATGDLPIPVTGLYGGVIEVTVTDAVGCPGLDSVKIETLPGSITNTFTKVSAVCTDNNGSAISTPANGKEPYIYQWSNDSMANSITKQFSGKYYLTITDDIGCVKNDSVTIDLINNVVINDNKTLIPAMCNSNNGVIKINPTNGYEPYSFAWSSGHNTDSIYGLSPGVYSVSITDVHGCNTNYSYTITLENNNSIKADFFFTPNDVIGGVPIAFSDSSKDDFPISNLKWYIDDELTLNDTTGDWSHVFTEGGFYDVKLLITDVFGCQDDTTLTVTIKSGLKAPNIFTPNGDGFNDVFTITSSGIEEFTIQIFNRWGVLVYTETSQYISWTGKTIAGVDVPSGTYYYILKATGKDAEKYEEKGYITLTR